MKECVKRGGSMLAIEEQKTNTEHDYVCCTTSSTVFKWRDHLLSTTRKTMMVAKVLFIKRVRKGAADVVNFSVSSRETIIFKVPYYWQCDLNAYSGLHDI